MEEEFSNIRLKGSKITTQKFDFIININENFELNFNEEEAKRLVNRLKKGSDDKTKKFAKRAIDFYKEMKEKAKIFIKNEEF